MYIHTPSVFTQSVMVSPQADQTDFKALEQAPASVRPIKGQKLSEITSELKRHLSPASRDILTSGRLLLEAKFLVGHGHFISWLQDHFSLSAKTANRFMSVADMVQLHQLSEPALTKLRQLDLRSLYELAAKSTPKSVQATLLAELKTGKISYELIREHKHLQQQSQPGEGAVHFNRLTGQFNRFEAWFTDQVPILKQASHQLDPESRQVLQQQASHLCAVISRVEALLDLGPDSGQIFQTVQDEAKKPASAD